MSIPLSAASNFFLTSASGSGVSLTELKTIFSRMITAIVPALPLSTTSPPLPLLPELLPLPLRAPLTGATVGTFPSLPHREPPSYRIPANESHLTVLNSSSQCDGLSETKTSTSDSHPPTPSKCVFPLAILIFRIAELLATNQNTVL